MLAPVIRQTSYSYEFTHPPKWWWNPNAQYPLMWLYLEIESLYMITRWHSDTNSACHCRRLRRCRFDPWARKIPWRREWQPTPVSFPGQSHEQRILEGYSPWSHKSQTRLRHREHTPKVQWGKLTAYDLVLGAHDIHLFQLRMKLIPSQALTSFPVWNLLWEFNK